MLGLGVGVLHCNTIQMGLVGMVATTFLFRGSPRNVKTRRFWPEGHWKYTNFFGRRQNARQGVGVVNIRTEAQLSTELKPQGNEAVHRNQKTKCEARVGQIRSDYTGNQAHVQGR